MLRFEGLDIYKESLEITNEIYTFTKRWPKEYLYDLTAQIRRAVLSIALNIAEGSGRGKKEFRRFLDIARGSCYECIPLIEIAHMQGLISKQERDRLYQKFEVLAKRISAFKNSL